MCGLLTNIHKDSIQLIEVSKKLKSINFANYIPLFLFDKIVECLSDGETKTETVKDTDALTKWLVTDRDGEDATDYHREVILQLYRDCVEQVGAPLSTEYPLTQIAIHHFACLHPEYVKQLLRNLSENIVFRIEGEQTESNHA